MDNGYDLYQHARFVVFHFVESKLYSDCYTTSMRVATENKEPKVNDSIVTCDKQTRKLVNDGNEYRSQFRETVEIDVSGKQLYRLFKKGKDNWNRNDLIWLRALSDFLRLCVKELIDDPKKKIKDNGSLHYAFIVPSEWEEDIREVLIRPMFVKANLVSKDDHPDRLLFCTDVESIYYYVADPNGGHRLTLKRNTILGRIVPVAFNRVLIKLDLIVAGNRLFDFFGSVMFPKIMNSNSLLFTSSDIRNGIRELIKARFSFEAPEDVVTSLMKSEDLHFDLNKNGDEALLLMKPFIRGKNLNKISEHQKKILLSIRPFDVCAEISKQLTNSLKDLLPSALIKEYSFLRIIYDDTSQVYSSNIVLNWSRLMLEYSRISLRSNYIIPKSLRESSMNSPKLIHGAANCTFNAIQNSVVHSKPRILSKNKSAAVSSIFLESEPDAIMNIEISLASTVLSFSHLDENGLIKEIWNHDYFVHDIR
ncbi:hypothetical protein EDC94DRAFT_281682 [Helicostylum pulchrum]|nr:hypothetical protein EDC94DRAFT_281682 [Helicostylum pulchrum]